LPPEPSRWRRLLARVVRRLRGTRRSSSGASQPAGALVAAARRAGDEGRWDEAVAAWERVLEAGEGPRPTALTRLGNAHRRRGDLDAAERVLREGADAHPDHVGIATELAQVAVSRRDWEVAVTRWERVLDLADRGPDARTLARLARAQVQCGELPEASATLARAAELHPDDADVAFEHARLAVVADDWDAAVTRWGRVQELTGPTPPAEVFAQLARAHHQRGDEDTATAVLEAGRALHPRDLDLLERAGDLATDRRDWSVAVRSYEELLERSGERTPARIYPELARAHRAQGHLEAAERVLALGREHHPRDPDIVAAWARVATAARDHERALERYAVAVALPGGATARVHRDRARAAAAAEAWRLADEALERGLAEHPNSTLLLVERAYMAIRRGDWEEVDRRWDEVTTGRAGPAPAYLYAGMGRRCAAAFEHGRADRATIQGIDAHPTDRGVHRQHVRNAISRQRRERPPQDWDWSDALARAEAALRAFGDHATPTDHLDLAIDLADASALDEARTILRLGVARFPGVAALPAELALLAGARGDWAETVEHLEPLARRPDVLPATRSALARAHLGRGDHARAAACLASSDLDDDPATLADRALVAATSGDHGAAIDAWRRATMVAPRSLRLRRRLVVALRRAGDEDGAREAARTARDDGLPLEANPGVVAIIGGGPSLRGVDLTRLRGVVHAVAVNATATVLPWCDVAVTHDASHLVERFRGFEHLVVAGLPVDELAARGRLRGFDLRRRLITDRLSERDDILHSGGHTSAHTALSYAHLQRPLLVTMFGIDLTHFWGPDDYWHGAMDEQNRRRFAERENRANFDRWTQFRARKLEDAPAVFASTVPQLEAAGTEVLNASPVSSVTCFPRLTPEEGIERCLAGALLTPDGSR
jgi:tetratricopeptide (TPR) repeat protein